MSKRLFITHGYMAYPGKHWFPWLKEQLSPLGVEVTILKMPNPDKPILEEWIATIQENVKQPDTETYFIGHSLGCIATLQYLNTLNIVTGGTILVAGFDQKIKELPELNNFVTPPLNYTKLQEQATPFIVFGSPQDYIVPFSMTQKLANSLEAELISIPNAGHFMQDDGFLVFPQILDVVKKVMHL
ncbi:RBBP9/YdeN family alpha/beta hydrolase [Rhizosphaericola mali]|uniref:Serine hydrolase family protein n=1 Tax=Rhizosphaericola mali TaxID=2545455 RepID=A0A5P2G130_9BACT|nr:alpha/beta hydrolase [Rhizosphaericola mali]QES89516.1 serine hydrolase family protein [Rhizosphaericola mali]